MSNDLYKFFKGKSTEHLGGFEEWCRQKRDVNKEIKENKKLLNEAIGEALKDLRIHPRELNENRNEFYSFFPIDFVHFLNDHSAYVKYHLNFINYHGKAEVQDIINNNPIQKLIDKAFSWRGTQEGWDFWNTLDIKWKKICG